MSDDQFTQLSRDVQQLSQTMEVRFQAVDQRFEIMDKKFDDQFTKLFKHMERKFNAVDHRFAIMDQRFESVIGVLSTFIRRTEIYHQEMLVLNHRVDCHDGWIHQLADSNDTRLVA